MGWSKLVDLALTPEEQAEDGMVMPSTMGAPEGPVYPYGTRICLTDKELSKLKLDIADVSIGDLIDLRCFGTVTSLSSSDGPYGPCERVEIQIKMIAAEDELSESEDAGD